MPSIERISVTLPAEMAAALRSTVEGGQYASTSEIVREALREWARARDREQRDLEALREAIRLGDESGPGIPADEVFAELRRMIADRRAATG
ncbi:type II toxin-antitoxin system ParD family antitoxin [Phenylobacterium sp.]|jgi:antitoxin ParD1/3/4|uniref:type II toxin-antitoxin system ParD family antitoxin n=1 Tax=Phenylobacterium sp. TaxID=1871053 RepID=UPI0037CBAF2C